MICPYSTHSEIIQIVYDTRGEAYIRNSLIHGNTFTYRTEEALY